MKVDESCVRWKYRRLVFNHLEISARMLSNRLTVTGEILAMFDVDTSKHHHRYVYI